MRRRINLGRDPWFGIALVVPLLLWVAATLIYPLLEALRLSFQNVQYLGTAGKYVGLSNYRTILLSKDFQRSAGLTIWWTLLNTAGKILLALVCAFALNQDYRGKTFVRNWIILPWVFPSIVLATMGKWLLDPTLGLINYILVSLGLIEKGISFLGNTTYALYVVTALNVWRWFPFFTVIFLAALQTIPKQMYEAAQIDGASRVKRLWYIDLPHLLPVIKVSTLIASLWSVNIFDLIWLLTRGGPASSTATLPIYIYIKGFQEFRISQAATAAIVLFVVLAIYGVIYYKRALDIELEG